MKKRLTKSNKKVEQMKKGVSSVLIVFAFCFSACSKHIPAVYEVVGMSLRNSNNTGQNPQDAVTDSVPKKAYAIKMTLEEAIRVKREGDVQENGFINEDELTALTIFSLANFDDSHPAGTPLNAYFLTALNSSATLTEFVSKGQIGGGNYMDHEYIENWTTDQYLFLMTPPAQPGDQAFVVKLNFSDRRTMSDTIHVKLY